MEDRPVVIDRPKRIGICISQAHTFLKDDFLCELDRAARSAGYGLLVFNSSLDWYWSLHGGNVTGCIYDMIRYDLLSALVILHGNIYDTEQLDRMIRRSVQSAQPVRNFYFGDINIYGANKTTEQMAREFQLAVERRLSAFA